VLEHPWISFRFPIDFLWILRGLVHTANSGGPRGVYLDDDDDLMMMMKIPPPSGQGRGRIHESKGNLKEI
jgi:hypothetical protein